MSEIYSPRIRSMTVRKLKAVQSGVCNHCNIMLNVFVTRQVLHSQLQDVLWISTYGQAGNRSRVLLHSSVIVAFTYNRRVKVCARSLRGIIVAPSRPVPSSIENRVRVIHQTMRRDAVASATTKSSLLHAWPPTKFRFFYYTSRRYAQRTHLALPLKF